jgi:hypothetical protein
VPCDVCSEIIHGKTSEQLEVVSLMVCKEHGGCAVCFQCDIDN